VLHTCWRHTHASHCSYISSGCGERHLRGMIRFQNSKHDVTYPRHGLCWRHFPCTFDQADGPVGRPAEHEAAVSPCTSNPVLTENFNREFRTCWQAIDHPVLLDRHANRNITARLSSCRCKRKILTDEPSTRLIMHALDAWPVCSPCSGRRHSADYGAALRWRLVSE
jgi:hypothetical protein